MRASATPRWRWRHQRGHAHDICRGLSAPRSMAVGIFQLFKVAGGALASISEKDISESGVTVCRRGGEAARGEEASMR